MILCLSILSQYKGKKTGEYRPALVLSDKDYNKKPGLLICCPISTSIRGSSTEVPVNNLERPSVVASNLINTLSWKERKVKKIAEGESDVMSETLLRLLPLIGADKLLEGF